jgi:S-adenosylmethionine-diacylglycerol 3-amino-3-carboxypropyl transferase
MPTEIAQTADFSEIRYAQCWEDADLLMAALDVQPEHTCLSIASAGDNTLALLSRGPKRAIAVDLNPAQLACLALRVAAYRRLSHGELVQFLGSRSATPVQRWGWYQRCRGDLEPEVQRFWERRRGWIGAGFGTVGKFERYLSRFRRYLLPLLQREDAIASLLRPKSPAERQQFYDRTWNHWRWRWGFKLFFSQGAIGRWGRDPSFFRYVEGNPTPQLAAQVRHALTTLDPSLNPYLQWILTGEHRTALPYALRPEQFEPIRAHLDRLEWHCCALEDYLDRPDCPPIDRFNLSNIFEYMSAENYARTLAQIAARSEPGGRWAYWNLFVPRRCPPELYDQITPRFDVSDSLTGCDRAFFYRDFVVESPTGSTGSQGPPVTQHQG